MRGSRFDVTALMVIATVSVLGCRKMNDTGSSRGDWSLDQRSYNLGSVGAFAEMVGSGVKELALSSPLSAEEMDMFLPYASEIAGRHGVDVYRESDFLVTDLFPSALTDGLHVLLIYRGATLERYLALKTAKRQLVESDTYDSAARLELARSFGKMLSYTEDRIVELLSANQ